MASVLLIAAAATVVGGVIVLFRDHWRVVVSVALGTAALALLIGNIGDLQHGWRRGAGPATEETERHDQRA